MSTIVIARFAVTDIAKAKAALASKAALLDEITEEAKRMGARHHRFLESDGELVVLDEWDSAASFRRFFESNSKIPEVTRAAGVTGPPRVEMCEALEAPGTF